MNRTGFEGMDKQVENTEKLATGLKYVVTGEPAPFRYVVLAFCESTPVVQWLSYSPLNPSFAGSIPAGVDGFFQSVKILSMTFFRREVNPWVPCRRLTARKRTSSRS